MSAGDEMRMTFPITQEWAESFAREWIAAWNSHDLNRICSHYAADIEFTSPFVTSLTGNVDGTVIRIAALRGYFRSALERFPGLEFKYMFTCAGIRTITVVYGSVNGLTAGETMELCAEGQIMRAVAQYSSTPRSV
jgi:SnoaL-like domain